jgi:hypothetical protein
MSNNKIVTVNIFYRIPPRLCASARDLFGIEYFAQRRGDAEEDFFCSSILVNAYEKILFLRWCEKEQTNFLPNKNSE